MSKYWERRYEQLKLTAMDTADESIKRLSGEYLHSLQQLQTEVESWYHRYAQSNNMTLADARKQLDKRELKAFKMTLHEYIKLAKKQDLPQKHIQALENASIRVRLDRTQQLLLQVMHYVSVVTKEQENEITRLLKKVYRDSTYKTAYETQTMMSKYKNVPLLDEHALDEIVHKPWTDDGEEFSTRIWSNGNELVNTLQREITKSLLVQEGDGKLAERIAKRYNVAFYQAKRLAETETAYIQEKASYEQYKSLDVKKYQILATLDRRTSEICRELDGKIVNMKDFKVGVTAPPFHCHCRTTTIPYIKGVTDVEDTRAMRDENGKTVYVDSKMTYNEWYKKYVTKE